MKKTLCLFIFGGAVSLYAGGVEIERKVISPTQDITTTGDISASNVAATYGVTGATGTFSGALAGATLDTGQGANELYDMNQNVLTTSTPTFHALHTSGFSLFPSSSSSKYNYIYLGSPNEVDNSSCTRNTDEGIYNGQGVFDHGASSESNHCTWNMHVPVDIDTSYELVLTTFTDIIGSDTSSRTYVLSMMNIGASGAVAGTFSNPITFTVEADASGVEGDAEFANGVTLTGWGSSLTPGDWWRIRCHRDGNAANDVSSTTSTVVGIAIRYREYDTY